MELNLEGSQIKDFVNALVKAFPDVTPLGQMVTFGLSENLNAISGDSNVKNAAFDLIVWAEAQGRTDELLFAARNEAPRNTPLRVFAEQFELAPPAPPEGELEALVLKSVKFQNGDQWRERMSQCELAVCRVETPVTMGTGFLVGPDMVMTNHHVVQKVIEIPELSKGVTLRFDYKMSASGDTLRDGITYPLESGDRWLIDSSPPIKLDYALLKVKGSPGEDEVGGQLRAPQRGWLTPEAYSFEAGEPLLIIQHPEAQPLSFSLGSVTDVKAARKRVAYTANALKGSSGSPCFNNEWDAVALHHYGHPTANEGVLFSAILEQPEVKAALDI